MADTYLSIDLVQAGEACAELEHLISEIEDYINSIDLAPTNSANWVGAARDEYDKCCDEIISQAKALKQKLELRLSKINQMVQTYIATDEEGMSAYQSKASELEPPKSAWGSQ